LVYKSFIAVYLTISQLCFNINKADSYHGYRTIFVFHKIYNYRTKYT